MGWCGTWGAGCRGCDGVGSGGRADGFFKVGQGLGEFTAFVEDPTEAHQADRHDLALIDAHDADAESRHEAAERLIVIERLVATLREAEADRQARMEVIERLDASLRESEADRRSRLEAIKGLDAALRESEADRQARLEVIEQLDTALRASEADREVRLVMIEELNSAVQEREAAIERLIEEAKIGQPAPGGVDGRGRAGRA